MPNVNFKAAQQHRSQFLQLSIKCDKSLLLILFLKILTLGFSLSVLSKDILMSRNAAVTKMADLTKSRQTDAVGKVTIFMQIISPEMGLIC